MPLSCMMISAVLRGLYLKESLLKINAKCWAWWCTPEFLTIRKETRRLMSIQGQPRLHSKLQKYTVRPCLETSNIFLTNEKFRKLPPEGLTFKNCPEKPWKEKENNLGQKLRASLFSIVQADPLAQWKEWGKSNTVLEFSDTARLKGWEPFL